MTKVLVVFEIRAALRPNSIKAERIQGLPCVVSAISQLGDLEWKTKDGNKRFNDESFGKALAEAVKARVSAGAGRKIGGVTTDLASDYIGWGPSSYVPEDVLNIAVALDESGLEVAFSAIADQLKVSDLNYVPRFKKGYAQDVHGLLWCACERDFSKLKDGPEARELMHSLAKVLPHLTNYLALPSPEGAPARLGWLNYWSPRAATAVGFPDPIKDAPILPLCRQFDDGAWLVKLTADPLDLQRPDHVAALAWAYQRFDKIGRRRTPEQEAAKKAAKRLKKAKEQAEVDHAEALHPSFAVYAPQHKGGYGKASTIHAATPEDALRIFFARGTKSRLPKPRETLAQLSAAWDEMASAMGDPLAAEFVAEPPRAANTAQPTSEAAMLEADYAHIAQSALQCWDTNVTELEKEELRVAVVDMLTEEGFSAELAEQAYALIEPAWAEVEGRAYSLTPEQARSPLFLAMLNEIRTGGWDIDREA